MGDVDARRGHRRRRSIHLGSCDSSGSADGQEVLADLLGCVEQWAALPEGRCLHLRLRVLLGGGTAWKQ
jgi:hypothetical protein